MLTLPSELLAINMAEFPVSAVKVGTKIEPTGVNPACDMSWENLSIKDRMDKSA
jgi:hypothetical protein